MAGPEKWEELNNVADDVLNKASIEELSGEGAYSKRIFKKEVILGDLTVRTTWQFGNEYSRLVILEGNEIVYDSRVNNDPQEAIMILSNLK